MIKSLQVVFESFFLVLTCAKYKLLIAVGLILVSSTKSQKVYLKSSKEVETWRIIYHVEKKKGIFRPYLFFESGIQFILGSFNVLFRLFPDKIYCFNNEICKF